MKLYLQLVDLEYQQQNVNEVELRKLFDQAINSSLPIEHRVAFSQRKLEYLEDFGSRVDRQVFALEIWKVIVTLELESNVPGPSWGICFQYKLI